VRYLSVCSGIEAASVAWAPLEWQPVAFSEIEPFPKALLAHHYPDVPDWGDMTRFHDWPAPCLCVRSGAERQGQSNGTAIGGPLPAAHQGAASCGRDSGGLCNECGGTAIDVLVGGTPCQSFSVAGLRAGLADPRGNLALTFLAIAGRYRPRWVVWENVPGVLSSEAGADFAAFLGGLGELGYGWAYRVLDAQYFGLAQRRKRVFVVGCARGWAAAAAVLFDPASLRGDPAPRRETGERAARPVTGGSPSGSGYRNDADTAGGLIPDVAWALRDAKGADSDTKDGHLIPVAFYPTNRQPEFGNYSDISPSIKVGSSSGGNPPGVLAFSCKDHGADAGELAPTLRGMQEQHGNANAGGQVAVAFDTTQITSKTNRSNPQPGDPSHPIPAHGHAPAIAFQGGSQQDQVTTMDGVSPSLAHSSNDHGGHHQPKVMNAAGVRRLTPRECERLQGFPDDYTLIPYRGKPASDGPRYRALGNSMAVPVVRWLGERLELVDALEVQP